MGLRTTAALVALAAGLGCQTPRTELVVVTDTDLTIPDEVDGFRVEVTAPGGRQMVADAPLGPGEPAPPRYVGVVPDPGQLGPYTIRASGLSGGLAVVSREAELTLEAERTLVLELFLSRDCINVVCGGGETCAAGNCRTSTVSADELSDWEGPPEPRDAGTPVDSGPRDDAGPPTGDAGPPVGDAGPCVPTDEVCNERDDDCDDMVDEGIDTTTDPMNCGQCGMVCQAANATAVCRMSACVIEACDAGFADCDGTYSTGCEADLSTPATCGSCTVSCTPPDRDCCMGACGRC